MMTMPPLPSAVEMATSSPKVAKAQFKTASAVQVSAAALSRAISSFMWLSEEKEIGLDLVVDVFHDPLERRRERLTGALRAFEPLHALAQVVHFGGDGRQRLGER